MSGVYALARRMRSDAPAGHDQRMSRFPEEIASEVAELSASGLAARTTTSMIFLHGSDMEHVLGLSSLGIMNEPNTREATNVTTAAPLVSLGPALPVADSPPTLAIIMPFDLVMLSVGVVAGGPKGLPLGSGARMRPSLGAAAAASPWEAMPPTALGSPRHHRAVAVASTPMGKLAPKARCAASATSQRPAERPQRGAS